jgi:dihydrofolate reductase
MAELYVSEFVSLDGVMEAPGGEDFKYPGWSFDFERGEEGDRFKLEETLSTDHSLLGRRTYEAFAAAWPERESDEEEGEFAKKLNEMPKYVVSSTITEPSWVNTIVISGDVPAARRRYRSARSYRGTRRGPFLSGPFNGRVVRKAGSHRHARRLPAVGVAHWRCRFRTTLCDSCAPVGGSAARPRAASAARLDEALLCVVDGAPGASARGCRSSARPAASARRVPVRRARCGWRRRASRRRARGAS